MTINEVLIHLDAAEQHLREVVSYDDSFDRDILTREEATRLSLAAYSTSNVRYAVDRYFRNHRMIDDAA